MQVENWNKQKGVKPCYPVEACPYCGEYPAVSKHYDYKGRFWAVWHYCDNVRLSCEAETQEKAVGLWNDHIESKKNRDAQLTLF